MQQQNRSLWGIVAFSVFCVFILWVLCGWAVPTFFGLFETAGQFGDSFNALNTLFTGCAFAVVLATLYHQSREIRDTQANFEKLLVVQNRTAELLQSQAEALRASARIQSLTSRIDGYLIQIKEAERGDASVVPRLKMERETLFRRLDEIMRSQGD